MHQSSRRAFTAIASGVLVGSIARAAGAQERTAQDPPPAAPPTAPSGPKEAEFARDYEAPKFKPSWKKEQINRQLVQDFVILAHSEFDMVKKLLEKHPGLLNGVVDWGGGDWESALGGASHMGRRDIVEYLLERGARIDIFCAAMLGQLEVVKSFLTLQPKLIDAPGPHGFFNLHVHAQVGGKESEAVLEYLQSIKKLDLKPLPFMKKPAEGEKKTS
jgi:hypothetical protein